MLTTGIGWAALPAELGFGSGWTCWRRLRAQPLDTAHSSSLTSRRGGEEVRVDRTVIVAAAISNHR